MTKFKLLLENPILHTYQSPLLDNNYILDSLGYMPAILGIKNKPFVFSCFALSVDGKLYYPDTKSGFSIAKCNHHATEEEQKGDLFILMMARAMSDAVIVGTKSLHHEHGSFLPDIIDSKLLSLRYKNKQSLSPTTIVICQSLDNINFNDKLFSDDLHQVIICCMSNYINLNKLPHTYIQVDLTRCVSKQDLSLKNIVICDNLDELILGMYKIGFNIILNESPFFHHQLLQLKFLDEIWLNYSGSYIGGGIGGLGMTQVAFDSKTHPDCELLTLHTLGYNFIYTRQRVLY